MRYLDGAGLDSIPAACPPPPPPPPPPIVPLLRDAAILVAKFQDALFSRGFDRDLVDVGKVSGVWPIEVELPQLLSQ